MQTSSIHVQLEVTMLESEEVIKHVEQVWLSEGGEQEN